MKPDIHRLIEWQHLLAAFNQIERITHRKHQGAFVAENDTEHSYNLAMTAWFLAGYFPELDKNRLIQYALIHDLVEVYAGDTYIYDHQEALDSKASREATALKRLEKEWADFSDMLATIHNYESKSTNEAKFIYALDKLMPIMLIYIHEGYSWKKHKVTVQMLHDNKRTKVELSPEILPYFEQLHALLLEHPEIIKAA